jgi:hypothetical protein
MRPWLLLAVLLAGVAAVPFAHAQVVPGDVYTFRLTTDKGNRVDVPINGLVNLPVTFHDDSRDNTNIVPTTGVPSATALQHIVTFEVVPDHQDDGWTVFSPISLVAYGGYEATVDVPFSLTAQVQHAFYPITLVAHVRVEDGTTYTLNTTLVGFSLGANSFSAQVPNSYQLHPRQIQDVPVVLTNLALAPRSFDMNVTDNPCGMGVAVQSGDLVPGKSDESFNISIQAPGNKLLYLSDSCTVAIAVSPATDHAIEQKVFVSVQVSGWYVDPSWLIDGAIALAVLLLLLLVLRRRKQRVEEEILGKPQKPWLIPVEALYLKALKSKDPRAWYVVRHYLMEDEYRSALLWYNGYKKATRGQRKKEGLVLRQERSYERWKAAWARAIARPLREADRHEARLQRKLDRRAKAGHRKQVRKYRKLTAKMRSAHAAQVERAGKAHAKAMATAQKKGLPPPKRPHLPEPDYPEEPRLEPVPLAGHKWAKKAGRFRARMVRRQGDLEVKFEKADARRLRKVRRKVARFARKLDDPDFASEHPLLRES